MSTQPFAFPPPPPPPKRDQITNGDNGLGNHFSQSASRGRGGSWKGQERRDGYAAGRSGSGIYHGGFSRGARGGRTPYNSSPGRGSISNGNLTGNQFQNRSVTQPDPQPNFRRSDFSSRNLNSSQKRIYTDAFTESSPRDSIPQAATTVPSHDASISNIIPQKPSGTASKSQDIVKSLKKGNLLGLTPTLGAGSASEDEEDEENEDEEVKVAQSINSCQFEYRGQKATLGSAAEIAAWIAERKRRFPTAAKAEAAKKEAEERRKTWAEEKRARVEAGKKKHEERMRTSKSNHRLPEKPAEPQGSSDIHSTSATKDSLDAATKAKRKAERLVKKLKRAEEQLAKAEEILLQAQGRSQNSITAEIEVQTVSNLTQELEAVKSTSPLYGTGEATTTSLKTTNEGLENNDLGSAIPELEKTFSVAHEVKSQSNAEEEEFAAENLVSDSSVLSSESDSESTSSSGSSDSDADSDSAPEESTTKKVPVERTMPPRKSSTSQPASNNVCRALLKTGRCKFGHRCRYSHDLPAKSKTGGGKRSERPGVSTTRKGLWQIMVEKEQEQDRETMLRSIVALGDNGVLGELEGTAPPLKPVAS